MKIKILLIVTILAGVYNLSTAETITIRSNFNTFTPDEVSIKQGDTVIFSIATTHNVVEVSQETWDVNGTESNGGFTLDFGGGQLVFDSPGTYYYICEPHASVGMKGIIEVSPVSS